MKKNIFAALALMFVAACQKAEVRYTQNSPEIETYKSAMHDYSGANWESLKSHYADTAKVFMNALENNPKTVDQMIETDKADAAIFSSYGVQEDGEYEMVVTDDGETWVNFWGTWKGTLAEGGKTFEVPVHLTARFINGKIVKEHGYWDNSSIMMALQELEAAKAADSTVVEKK